MDLADNYDSVESSIKKGAASRFSFDYHAQASSESWAVETHRNSMEEALNREKAKEREGWSSPRLICAAVIESRAYDIVSALVIVFSAVLIIQETDIRAAKEEIPAWRRIANFVVLFLYCTDLACRVYVLRRAFLATSSNAVDFFVCLADLVSSLVIILMSEFPSVAFLRSLRLARLGRFIRVLSIFKELNFMLSGFMSAIRAMFWAGFLIFVIVTFCSILFVELVDPIVQRLVERGVYEDCERCSRAYSSVMSSNLTILQNIIAGDSWGLISIPVIEEEPFTAILFFVVLIIVNLGLLNLVLTVIVDVANSARHADEVRKARERSWRLLEAKGKLLDLCGELDVDGSGELTIDELQLGMKTNSTFAATMESMDVGADDLHVMFRVLDEDLSGTISYREFVEQLHKMKSQNTHAMLIFMTGYLNEVRLKVSAQLKMTRDAVATDLAKVVQAINAQSRIVMDVADPKSPPLEAEAYEIEESSSAPCSPSAADPHEATQQLEESSYDGDIKAAEVLLLQVAPAYDEGGGGQSNSIANLQSHPTDLPDDAHPSSDRGQEHASGRKPKHLPETRAIREDIQRLSQRMEGELAELLREVAGKVEEQLALLRDWAPPAWPKALEHHASQTNSSARVVWPISYGERDEPLDTRTRAPTCELTRTSRV